MGNSNKIDVELIKEKIRNGSYSPNIFGTGSKILNNICNNNTNKKIQKSCYNLQKLFVEQIYINYNKKINNLYCYSDNIEKKSKEHFEETDIKTFINKNIDVIMEQKKKNAQCPLIVKEQEKLLNIYKTMKNPKAYLDVDINFFGIPKYQRFCEIYSDNYHCEKLNDSMKFLFSKFIKNNSENKYVVDGSLFDNNTWHFSYHMYNLRKPEDYSEKMNSIVCELDFIATALNNQVEFNKDKIFTDKH